MKHLPTIEALTASDDAQLVAELKISEVLTELARVRALVDRADRLVATVLDQGAGAELLDEDDLALAARLLARVPKFPG